MCPTSEEEHQRTDMREYFEIDVDTVVGADEDPDVHVDVHGMEHEGKS